MAKVVQCDICGKIVPYKQAYEISFTRVDKSMDEGMVSKKKSTITGDYCDECSHKVAALFNKALDDVIVIDSEFMKDKKEK